LSIGTRDLSPARICIISPRHLAANPRLVKEANTLAEAGYSVEVICGRYSRWGVSVDAKLINPYWRAQYVSFGPSEAHATLYMRQTILRKLAKGVASAGFLSRTISETAYDPATPDLTKTVMKTEADLYIAHYVAALPAAARAAKKYKVPYAFDAEDFHLGDLPDGPENVFEKNLISSIEKSYIRDCAYVTAASPLIAEAYREVYGIKAPIVLLNSFPLRQAPSDPTVNCTKSTPSLYWFSQTIGPDRGLECAVQAVGIAKSKPHLYLRGAMASGYETELMKYAAEADAKHRVHILPLEEPDKMELLASSYDIGLVLETGHSKSRQFCLTNKLFSFLLAGVPPIMSDTAAHRAFAIEAGLSELIFPIGDPTALSNIIDCLLLLPGRLETTKAKIWRLGRERYNWEGEQGKLLAAVRSVIGVVNA